MRAHSPRVMLSAVQRPNSATFYRIRVRGVLGETLLGAFPNLEAEAQDGDMVLAGALPDQAALFGVLGEIEALGLELLEVRRVPCSG